MVTNPNLSEINGVGSGTADSLMDAGFETVADVAESDVDEIADVDGFGESRASDVIESASEMIDVQSDDDELDVDEELDVDLYDVEINTSSQVLYHVVHVVLEEATSQHQSNAFGLRNNAYELSRTLMGVVQDQCGDLSALDDRVEATVSLEKDQLNAFYRALSQGSQNYASRSGITSMYGDLESLRKTVNEKRQEAIRS